MNEKIKNFKKICVVGAGPAGSLTAYLCALQGFDVTLLEKHGTSKRKVCGEYLCPLGVELMRNLKIESIIEDFNPVYGMKIVSPNFTSFLSFFPKKNEINYGVSVNREVFDERLRVLARDSGVKLLKNELVTNLKKIGDSWEVKTQNLSETFDLVIAADGINSTIAKILGHKKERDKQRVALHCYIKLNDPLAYSRLGQMHIFEDGSYVGIDPIHKEEMNFSVVCSADKLKKYKKHDLINSYIEKSPELKPFCKVDGDEKIFSAGTLKSVNRFIAGDGLAYVGDSAGFIDPLTGEGIYGALQGAYLLAKNLEKKPNNLGLEYYKKNRKKYFFEKNILNSFFQVLIKFPFFCNLIARFLKSKQQRADIFVGIIGNIYKPLEGLKKLLGV